MAEHPPPQDPAPLLPEADQRLIRDVDALPDTAYAEPSLLPGWSRGHVVAHLLLNAEGLAGALRGILEGERVPMYPSQEARDGDIDELAGADPAELRARLMAGCTDLESTLQALPHDQHATTIDRVPGGRMFTAGAVAGMRLREVEIHHADLGADYRHTDWPAAFARYLLTTMLDRGPTATPLVVRAEDLGETWRLGDDGPTVSGSAADLAWWLTGRGSGEGLTSDTGVLPEIGAW